MAGFNVATRPVTSAMLSTRNMGDSFLLLALGLRLLCRFYAAGGCVLHAGLSGAADSIPRSLTFAARIGAAGARDRDTRPGGIPALVTPAAGRRWGRPSWHGAPGIAGCGGYRDQQDGDGKERQGSGS